MKTILKLSGVVVMTVFVLTACSKYEDGPAFSLLTKKSRLSGEWVVDQVLYNDQDATQVFVALVGTDYVLEIAKDGTYRTEGISDKGTWDLGEDKDDIYMLSDTQGAIEQSFRILRLKNKELWLRQTQSNGDVQVIHYKAK